MGWLIDADKLRRSTGRWCRVSFAVKRRSAVSEDSQVSGVKIVKRVDWLAKAVKNGTSGPKLSNSRRSRNYRTHAQ